jgi:hypothetical protein
MYVKYKLNVLNNLSGSTINIPINMDYHLIDQSELIERVFVDTETKKAINEIVDYEKVRYIPVNLSDNPIKNILYNVVLVNGNTYASAGFNNEDLELRRENFKQTYLNLNFYDSDNPMNQNLLFNTTMFSRVYNQVTPISNLPIIYIVNNPLMDPNGFSEGYFIYHYKDFLKIGETKYIYMRASFKNAKDGKSTNLCSTNIATPIDELVSKLHVRYKLFRTESGYYYKIDNTYKGNDFLNNQNTGLNNVIFINNDTMFINLYQINVV